MSRVFEALAPREDMLPPRDPGPKQFGTARAARDSVGVKALQAKVLAALEVRASTADEIANALGIDRLSIRPRLSELNDAGYVVPSGERRKNASGRSAVVWRIK